MSARATPAFSRAEMTRATASELAASAAAAVLDWLTVPKENAARSGVTVVEPMPVTVITLDGIVSAAAEPSAPEGWRTPANAAPARPVAASSASFIVPPSVGGWEYDAGPRGCHSDDAIQSRGSDVGCATAAAGECGASPH